MKTKLTSLITAAACLVLLCATIAGAQNLATNPGFETGDTSGWFAFGSPTISAQTNQVHSGNYAGLVTDRTATYMGIAQSFEGVMQSNQTYNVSVWVRLVSGPSQTMWLTMKQVDGNGTTYPTIAAGSVSTNDWTQLAGQFTLNYSGTLSTLTLYAQVESSATASYYIDDLVVQPPFTATTNGACTVDRATVFQRIDGFGASSAWDGNWTTSQADMFFSTNNGTGTSFDGMTNFPFTGVGLSLLRNHIDYANSTSASDAASTWETGIMQMAQARGARVWSTPWTPAAGFKSINDIYDSDQATNGGIDGGSYLGSGNNITNVNYASQLANYVASMKSQGINLYAISVQNEPDADVTTYEACQWTGAQIHDFVTNLYSALAAEGVGSTKIIIPESQNWTDPHNLMGPTLNDTNSAADVSIIADHNYVANNVIGDTSTPSTLSVGGKAVWETEVSQLGGSYDGSITNAIYWAGRIHLFMTAAQANAWHYWWLVPAGSDNAALVDTNGIPAKRMYALGQFARFVRPDYYRINIATNSSSAQISAYQDSTSPNFAIVAINSGLSNVIQVFNLTNVTGVFGITPWITSATMSLSNQTPVAVSGSSFTYTLPPLSIVTFVRSPLLITSTADSGPGTLRAALAGAATGDIIDASGLTGTIALTSGQLNVSNSVTVLGPGPGALTVSGNNASRVFNVTGTNVTISGLTIANGQSPLNGAGINAGGSPGSVVTINNCIVTNNSTTQSGGGICNNAGVMLTITNCTLAGNSAQSGNGGGIYNQNGMLTVVASTLSSNSAGVGGGIDNDGGSGGNATMTLNTSTISSNSAYEGGGGILNWGQSGSATLTVNASTFSGNSAGGSGGGGIFNNNYAGTGSVEIADTIFSAGSAGANIYNYSGPVKSAGYNLSSDDGGGYLTNATDLLNTDPKLGPLQENGGPTRTCALLPGSPAIDQGNRDAIPALALNTDQRGLPRPVILPGYPNAPGGDGSDIGAFEVQCITVTNTADSGPGSLRQVLAAATNANPITFSVTGTITLTSGQLNVSNSVIVLGPGPAALTVSGNNASRVFNVTGTNVTISGLTIANGNTSLNGAGIYAGGGAGSSITINNCVVTNNRTTQYGGGIYNSPGVTMTVSHGTLSANSAAYGGGIYNGQGALSVLNSTFSGNSGVISSVYGEGGGLYNCSFGGSATVTINASTFSGNPASYSGGGGLYNYSSGGSAAVTINASTFSSNSTYGGGGGCIFNDGRGGGSATVQIGDTILNNGGVAAGNIYNTSGTITSAGYNLSSDAGGGFLTATNDQLNTNPKLGPLANNGGPTLTMLPLFGSPAIDAGDDAVTNFLATDQRGYPRCSGAHVDIGAVEAQWAPANHPPLLRNSTWIAAAGARCFQFTFSSVTNADFTVLATTNLALPLPDWTRLAPVIQCSPGQYQFTDLGATNYPQCFYRIVSP